MRSHLFPIAALLAVLCLAITEARAQLFDRYAPKKPPQGETGTINLNGGEPSAVSSPGETLLPSLKSLLITDDERNIAAAAAGGIQVSGLPWLDTERTRGALDRFIGQPLTEGSIQLIRAAVFLACRDHDHPLVVVSVPEQDITEGGLALVVTAARLGTVETRGNEWFSADFLSSQIRCPGGGELTGSLLREDIEWLNANPFREVNVLLRSGSQPGTTDLLLDVNDRIPFRVFAGYEDSGNDLLKEERVFFGFNWGNVLGLDHRLDFQWTAAPDFETVNSLSAAYTIPLPWRHTLQLYGGYTDYQPDLPELFLQEGEAWQAGARYSLPLPEFWRVRHSLSLGFDYKHADNSLEFGGLPVTTQDTDIAELSLAWAGLRKDKLGSTALGLSLICNPGWTGSTDEDFAEARPGAEEEFVIAKLDAQRLTRLPWDSTWAMRFSGQLADGPLVGSETFELGGYRSIRGYEEYEVAADDGLVLSNELRLPGFSLFKLIGWDNPNFRDELQFLGFIDYGYGRIRVPDSGGEDDESGEDDDSEGGDITTDLASAGVGLRWQVAKSLSVRFDYGWQLTDSGFSTRDRSSRAHVGVTVSF